MFRTSTAIVLLLITGNAAYSDAPPTTVQSRPKTVFEQRGREEGAVAKSLGFIQPGRIHQSNACCKICSTGQACGNTCISRNDLCRVGPGCACDN
jgi:hypothetical protein